MLKVHAFDPGVTTGYASGVIEDGKLGVVSGQAKWNELQLYIQLKMSNPDIIVFERFEYRSQKAYNVDNAELFSRNLIGVMNLFAQEREGQGNPLEGYYAQMPASAIGKGGYWTDAKLKEAHVYKVGNVHANDAMRHLLQWWQFGAGFKYNTNGFEPLA